MILIADSGATKTDWRLLKNNELIFSGTTTGISPYYQNFQEIYQTIDNQLLSKISSPEKIQKIYFYGTGCTAPETCDIVKQGLSLVFPQADIQITHDMMASARALCGRETGIACILGTGANACFYDGEKITSPATSLGYVLGDEGSGAYLGKYLIINFLHKRLSPKVQENFAKKYPHINRLEVLDNLYKKPFPSRYLASFVPFLAENLDEPYCQNLIFKGFIDFLDLYVMIIPDYKDYPVHFTGSIAFYFQVILSKALQTKKILKGNILHSPIEGLVKYHLE